MVVWGKGDVGGEGRVFGVWSATVGGLEMVGVMVENSF